MTETEALAEIRGLAGANRIVYSSHSEDRSGERTVTYRNLWHALMNATRAKLQANGRWKASGKDLDGDHLDVVLIIEGDLIIITVF